MATNILVQDDTDSTRTLIPAMQDGNSAVYRTATSGLPVDGQTRMSLVWEQMRSGVWRCSIKLEVPFMETASGSNSAGYDAAPAVAYVVTSIFTIFAPARSTAADRAHAVRMMAHAVVGAAATADQGFHPGTAASGAFQGFGAANPVPNLLVNLIPVT